MRPLRLLVIPALLLAATPAWAQPAVRTGELERVLAPHGPYQIQLSTLVGQVVVHGWNKNLLVVDSRVSADRTVSGEEATIFKTIAPVISQDAAGNVTVATRVKGEKDQFPAVLVSKAPHVQIAYDLWVPPQLFLTIRQESGPITVYGMNGRLDAFTHDGAIHVGDFSGRAEAANDRGALSFEGIDGDAIGRSYSGGLSFHKVSGDIEARTETGDVSVAVDPHFSGDVAFHSVRGVFRSDLATFDTEYVPDDPGYVGIMRGPLAGKSPLASRIMIDTVSGTGSVAVDHVL